MATDLIEKVNQIRKKKLSEYSIEDLRLCIRQNISLDHLIPIAIEHLEKDIFVEGDLFEGDLLKSILDSDTAYWKTHLEQWNLIKKLYLKSKDTFDSDNIHRQIRQSFERFENI